MTRLPLLVVGLVVACKPGGEPSGRRAPTSSGSASASPSARPLASAPTYDPEWRQPKRAPTSDPLRGHFGMAEVDRALPGEGDLVATITTTLGTLRCTLLPQRAPHHVAAFVGLAGGLRPFQDAEGWSTRPAYDGTAIDRVVRGQRWVATDSALH